MNLRVLRYFVTVAREESIMKAAEVLHVTQPTLSRQLKELEAECGSPLFIRGNRSQGIVLTEKGIILRRRAEEMLMLADRTQEEMLRSEDDISGKIVIGCGESAVIRILARCATEIRKQHPGVVFDLFSGNAEDVKDKLDQGLLDFGIFIEPTSLERYHTLRLPGSDRWGLLVNKQSPLADKASLCAKDLVGIPLLVSSQKQGAEGFAAWSGISADELQVVGTYNLLYNASLMVSEGYASALCIDKIIHTSGTNLRFIPLEPGSEVHLSIAWKKYQPLSKACSYFLSRLQNLN